jgi:hypothetical protein
LPFTIPEGLDAKLIRKISDFICPACRRQAPTGAKRASVALAVLQDITAHTGISGKPEGVGTAGRHEPTWRPTLPEEFRNNPA